MSSLIAVLHRQSPRYSPRPIPVASRLIGAAVPALFALLILQAFLRQGLAAWSVGLVYIAYDTVLLAFTAWQIRALTRDPVASVATSSAPRLGVMVRGS